jgi:hypothetical protein
MNLKMLYKYELQALFASTTKSETGVYLNRCNIIYLKHINIKGLCLASINTHIKFQACRSQGNRYLAQEVLENITRLGTKVSYLTFILQYIQVSICRLKGKFKCTEEWWPFTAFTSIWCAQKNARTTVWASLTHWFVFIPAQHSALRGGEPILKKNINPSASQEIPSPFYGIRSTLPCSQKHATRSYLEQDQCSPYPHSPFLLRSI